MNATTDGDDTVFFQGIYSHTLQRYLRYDEELVIPIIENTPFEKDLEERMNQAIEEYPGTTAILVRRHGIYVWGETWQKAKTQWVHNVIAYTYTHFYVDSTAMI